MFLMLFPASLGIALSLMRSAVHVPIMPIAYYHPSQKGSASLKAVLPAITGNGYKDLDINNGQIASILYLSAICSNSSGLVLRISSGSTPYEWHGIGVGDMPETEKTKVMTDLEKYCGRDTEGMIWIADKLRELVDK